MNTHGIIINTTDLKSYPFWAEKAKAANINTIGLHIYPVDEYNELLDFIKSDTGLEFLEKCKNLGIEIEYEMHAMSHLLPRDLFHKNPEMFRLDENGNRVKESNFCLQSKEAFDIIAENTIRIAKEMCPSTSRYFLWADDGTPWCKCDKCKELSESDQSMLVDNFILKTLKTIDKNASLSHLSYFNTLKPPTVIKPEKDIFLEYAPISRNYDIPYKEQTGDCKDNFELFNENLKIFPVETAQVLEYWLDVSLFSSWKKPAIKLPFKKDIVFEDVKTYREKGINNITSFFCFVDNEYIDNFGFPETELNTYGEILHSSMNK